MVFVLAKSDMINENCMFRVMQKVITCNCIFKLLVSYVHECIFFPFFFFTN